MHSVINNKYFFILLNISAVNRKMNNMLYEFFYAKNVLRCFHPTFIYIKKNGNIISDYLFLYSYVFLFVVIHRNSLTNIIKYYLINFKRFFTLNIIVYYIRYLINFNLMKYSGRIKKHFSKFDNVHMTNKIHILSNTTEK